MMTSIMFPAVIVGGIGLICAIVLVVAAKVMALPADELFDSIRAELPGRQLRRLRLRRMR